MVKTAPGKNAPGKNAPGKNAPGKNAPGKNAPGKNAPLNKVGKNAPSKSPIYLNKDSCEIYGKMVEMPTTYLSIKGEITGKIAK